jgi:hypothetical protein
MKKTVFLVIMILTVLEVLADDRSPVKVLGRFELPFNLKNALALTAP